MRFHEHVLMWRKWTICLRGQLVIELWFKFISRIGNVLIKVTLRFIRLAVIFIKKILFYIMWVLVCTLLMQQAKRIRLFIFWSVLSLCHIFKFFKVRELFRKKIKQRMCFLQIFVWNISYFKRKWRVMTINASMPFIKYPKCLSDFKGTVFFSMGCCEVFKY